MIQKGPTGPENRKYINNRIMGLNKNQPVHRLTNLLQVRCRGQHSVTLDLNLSKLSQNISDHLLESLLDQIKYDQCLLFSEVNAPFHF